MKAWYIECTFPLESFICFENPEVKAALVDYRVHRFQSRSLEAIVWKNQPGQIILSIAYQVLCSAIPLNKINNGEI